jgi:hypothetical protein
MVKNIWFIKLNIKKLKSVTEIADNGSGLSAVLVVSVTSARTVVE